ncbi:hypothetical protein DAPPUDRAFT_332640 [Daphnia pulex]|uniref:HAT C-terminal dimerisation domain-containing protein n=1 Tax=Daphnia pulex TaxID=6669 RepID=E9HQI6_DAPPU|nr:hypothetical protein DAPPUDRAFT_332640 [Daphnia pulex]|eukprot:EFX65994.1 hypothetical protein DAPPUDRAFT_332640 [Daphnia pulex]
MPKSAKLADTSPCSFSNTLEAAGERDGCRDGVCVQSEVDHRNQDKSGLTNTKTNYENSCSSFRPRLDRDSTQMKGSHTAQAIVAEYEHVIKSWKLPISKIVRVVTDGGSNILASDFDIQLPSWQSLDGSVSTVTESFLLAHYLNETSNPTRQSRFNLTIDNYAETVPLWETFVELAEELRQASAEDRNFFMSMKILSKSCKIQFFFKQSDNGGCQKQFRTMLAQTIANTPVKKTQFEEASDDFQADYETVRNLIPAYLDLVNKLSITTIKSSGFSESQVLEAVRKKLESKSKALRNRNHDSATTNSKKSHQAENVRFPPPPKKSRKGCTVLLSTNPSVQILLPHLYMVLEEFEACINEPNVSMEEAVDPLKPEGPYKPVRPLEFLKLNQNRFPIFGAIAQDLFGIPASSGNLSEELNFVRSCGQEKRNLDLITLIKGFVPSKTISRIGERCVRGEKTCRARRTNPKCDVQVIIEENPMTIDDN